jgi:hypothetical protein
MGEGDLAGNPRHDLLSNFSPREERGERGERGEREQREEREESMS